MKTLQKRAAKAALLLWRMATDEEAPRAERIKLLQWYVELGIGKPGMIDKSARDEGMGERGVMLLPLVLDAPAEDAAESSS